MFIRPPPSGQKDPAGEKAGADYIIILLRHSSHSAKQYIHSIKPLSFPNTILDILWVRMALIPQWWLAIRYSQAHSHVVKLGGLNPPSPPKKKKILATCLDTGCRYSENILFCEALHSVRLMIRRGGNQERWDRRDWPRVLQAQQASVCQSNKGNANVSNLRAINGLHLVHIMLLQAPWTSWQRYRFIEQSNKL